MQLGQASTPGARFAAAAPLALGGLAAGVLLIVAMAFARGPYGGAGGPASAAPHDGAQGDDGGGRRSGGGSSARVSASGAPLLGGTATGASSTKTELGLPTMELRKAREAYDAKMRLGDLKGALGALEALLAIDPDALADGELRRSIISLAQTVTLMKGDEPDRLFGLLAAKAGPRGPDLLFELVTTRGSSEAAKVAAQLLEQEAVLSRASEAVQLAYKLRKAKGCEAKKVFFADAGAKGDRRTFSEVQLATCGRRVRDNCCDAKDPALVAAMEAFAARGIKQ